MAQISTSTTDAQNFDPVAAQATLNAVRARLVGSKTIRAQDIRDIINVYNAWTQHNHTVYDYYYIQYGDIPPYDTQGAGDVSSPPILPAEIDNGLAASWSTPGTYYWTVPAGVNQLQIRAFAGGGGGGGAWSGSSATVGGGGGSGGVLDATFAVSPGTTLTIIVGSGGNGGGARGGAGISGGTGGSTRIIVPSVADWTMYGGGGGHGQHYGGVGGIGPSKNGYVGGNAPNGNVGGTGANSEYTVWHGTATAGAGSRYTGGAGSLGGGGGGGGGSNNNGERYPGGNGGNGYASIYVPVQGAILTTLPTIAVGNNIILNDIRNLMALINAIRSHLHRIEDGYL